MLAICTSRGRKKERRRSKGREPRPSANGGSNLRVMKAWFMARDCLLSSFLLSQFDDAPGVLLLLSHLEPTEEQTPHSSFPRSPPFSLTPFLILLSLLLPTFFRHLPARSPWLPSFPVFRLPPFSVKKKTNRKVLLLCWKEDSAVYKGLLYVLPPFLLSALTQTVSGWPLVRRPPSLPFSFDKGEMERGIGMVEREEAQWEFCQWLAVLKGR